MAETFSDPRQKEHIANLGKQPEPLKVSPAVEDAAVIMATPKEEVIDVVATPGRSYLGRNGTDFGHADRGRIVSV